jgi:hypothetical protein
MREIALTQGKVALVDDEDFEELNKHKWSACKLKHAYYASRSVCHKGKESTVKMHREILKVADPKILIDHKDHDGLNNQKYNIRTCTSSENQMNKKAVVGSSSKYIGVCWHKKDKKWQAAISVNKKQKYLGQFDCPIKAAIARDKKAIELHGEFANLNFK